MLRAALVVLTLGAGASNRAHAQDVPLFIAHVSVIDMIAGRMQPDVTVAIYTTTWFDMWRFVDGKADEHWDPAIK